MKDNELKQEQLEKVNGGGVWYSCTQVTWRDLLNKTVEFKTTTKVSFSAKVTKVAIYRTTFCGQTAYKDVYYLQFNDTTEQSAWGGYYPLGDARDYFDESNKITDTSTIFNEMN